MTLFTKLKITSPFSTVDLNRGWENYKIVLAFILLLLPAISQASLIVKTPSSLGLTSGLVGYWTFDGNKVSGANALDSSGQNNTGVITGATKVIGKIGQGLRFNGGTDNIVLNSTITLGNGNWTVSSWVKMVSTEGTVLSNNSGGPVTNEAGISTGKIYYRNYDGVWNNHYGAINISDGRWHYLTWVNFSNQTMNMYVDGVLDGGGFSSVTNNGGPVNSIGRNWSFSTDGYIDDVRVYNRALSTTEITRLYNIGVATKINKTPTTSLTSGLVGWWTMDGADISGNTLVDKSGSGNNGTKSSNSHRGVIGKIGQGMEWFTDGSPIPLTNNSSLSSADHLTLAGWIRLDHYGTYYAVQVMNKWTGTGDANYAWYLFGNYLGNGNQGNLVLYANCGGAWQGITPSYRLSEGVWYHVAATYDSVSGGQLYINGEPYGSHVASCGALATNNAIANLNMGLGVLDDARIYNRTLSTVEIKKLYNMGVPTKINKSPTNSLTSGLVGYWTFDGSKISGANALDSSGLGNTGTITGATKTIGKIGQGLSFNGSGNNVDLGSLSSLSGNNETISFWQKTYSKNDFGGFIDSSVGGGATDVRFYIGYYHSGSPYLFVFIGDGNTYDVFNFSYTIPLNVWEHYVVVLNGSSLKVFLNGAQLGATQTVTKTLANASYKLAKGFNGAGYFNGLLDDVRIYNRALSTNEVKQLYNMGR